MTESDPDHDTFGNDSSRPWMRMAGMGIELASITLGLAAVGYFLDWWAGNATPYATALGALIGFCYGMFRFIQKATGGI